MALTTHLEHHRTESSDVAVIGSSEMAGMDESEKADTLPHSPSSLKQSEVSVVVSPTSQGDGDAAAEPVEYRLYKRRFVGLVALVILNIVGAMSNGWFGPIANNVSSEFGFSLDDVNWLGNVVSIALLPSSIVVPFVCMRFGIRITCCIGVIILLLSGWIRFSGTAHSLSKGGAYGLIILGQILAGLAQPIFQVVGPLYSETWFDLKGRTTATMLLSVATPVGAGVSQLVSPVVGSTRSSILVFGIICTAAVPCAILIGNAPPTPPTYAASRQSPSFMSLVRAMAGREPQDRASFMSRRERLDFVIVTLLFSVFAGVVTAFTVLTGQDFGPYGYSDDISGFMGATLLLAGLVCAAVTAPLFDRVLTHHLAWSIKVLCPALAALWLSLIWAVKPNDTGALFAIMAIIGGASITLLPVAIELAVEVTRNADGSTAILWFGANVVSIACVLIEGALRAGPDAKPPNNMRRALIFQAALVCGAVVSVAFLQGKQARRETDERKLAETKQAVGLAPTPAT